MLATGHNSPPEVKLMVKEAVRVGVKHIIITHPLLDIVEMEPKEIKEVVAMGPEIYAEFTSQFGNPNARPEVVKLYLDTIRLVGPEHSFISSDTGQLNSNWQPDALANCAKLLRANGFTEREHRPDAQDQSGEDSRDRAAGRHEVRYVGPGLSHQGLVAGTIRRPWAA